MADILGWVTTAPERLINVIFEIFHFYVVKQRFQNKKILLLDKRNIKFYAILCYKIFFGSPLAQKKFFPDLTPILRTGAKNDFLTQVWHIKFLAQG